MASRLLPDTSSMKEILIYTGQRSPVAWQHPPAQGTGRWTPRCWWQLERAAADPGCAGRQQRCPCTRPGRLQLLQPAHKIWWRWSPARPAEEHTETEACLHMTWRGKLPAKAGSNRHICCSVLVMHGAIGLSLLLLARLLQGKLPLYWEPASPAGVQSRGAWQPHFTWLAASAQVAAGTCAGPGTGAMPGPHTPSPRLHLD